MDAFANAVREQISPYKNTIEDTHLFQQYGINSYLFFSFDVADVIRQLNGGTLPASFQQILDQTVLAKSCITNHSTFRVDEDRYSGIGMYIPDAVPNTRWNDYYRSAISWYQAVWSE